LTFPKKKKKNIHSYSSESSILKKKLLSIFGIVLLKEASHTVLNSLKISPSNLCPNFYSFLFSHVHSNPSSTIPGPTGKLASSATLARAS
jgi:hypothetical protein